MFYKQHKSLRITTSGLSILLLEEFGKLANKVITLTQQVKRSRALSDFIFCSHLVGF